ncbi:hypothetical protein Purlil1_2783 [Purpureocillium lilacinum]|uniref:Uncharacterized protein n=2 Tax=Purpureocillium lilacinum TaxID=33203 RepID=A0ABR0CA99_PURLI|nr:hypothetical protein Purlil1_2783 [Purpureocillium lilacinum]
MDGSLSRAPPVGWPCPAAAAAGARWVGNLNSRPGRAAPLRPGWSQVSGRLSLAARRCGWVTGNSASVWMCEIDGLVCLGACAWVAEQMLIVAALVVDSAQRRPSISQQPGGDAAQTSTPRSNDHCCLGFFVAARGCKVLRLNGRPSTSPCAWPGGMGGLLPPLRVLSPGPVAMCRFSFFVGAFDAHLGNLGRTVERAFAASKVNHDVGSLFAKRPDPGPNIVDPKGRAPQLLHGPAAISSPPHGRWVGVALDPSAM